jgi:hypothetical protein
MTLDEAIKHCLNVAETCTVKACANDHKQIAKWLKDYKRLLAIESGNVGCTTCIHFDKDNAKECYVCYQYSSWEGDFCSMDEQKGKIE